MIPREKIEEIVRKIADELGEEFTEERLKSAALEALARMEDKRLPQMGTVKAPPRIIVTGFGEDKPGILASITTLLAELNINILDLTQKILEGVFTIIILADTSKMKGDFETLKARLHELSQKTNVRFEAQSYSLFEAMHRV